MQTIIVKQGQSVFDIAIVYTGDVKSSFEISVMNGISITDNLHAGQVLNVPDVINKNIVALFNEKNQPATALRTQDMNAPEGIGYWYIQKDFKVS